MDLSGFSEAERALIMGMSTFADEGAAPVAGPSEPKPKKRSSSSAKRALKPVVPTPTPDIEAEPSTSRKSKGKKRADSELADAETADQKHAAKLLRRARKKARRKAEEERLAAEAETMAQLDREAAAASKKRRKSEPSHQPPPPDEPVVKIKKRKSEPAPPPPRDDPSPAPAPTSKKRKREAERESPEDNEASAEPPRERNKKRQKVDVVEDATPAPEVQQAAGQRRGSGRKSATLAREALSQQYALSATDPAHDRRASSSPRESPRISEAGAASSADDYGVATPPPPVIKRKVGRPRKHPLPSPSPGVPQSDDDGEDADEPVVEAPPVVKRGPGRPPKRAPTTPAVVPSDDDDDDEAAVEAAPVVKRGPGRPRKHPLPPMVAVASDGEREDDEEDAPPLVKRKVGGPRQIPVAPVEESSEPEPEAAPVVGKRKRGRPPKLVRVPKPPTAPADDEREDDRVPPPAVAAPAKRPVGRPRKAQAPVEEAAEVDESTDEAAIAASMVPRKDPSPAPAPVAAVAPAEPYHPNRIPEASWPHLFYQQPLGARPRVLLAEDAWPRQGAFVPLTDMPGFVGLEYIAQAFDRAHASFTDGVIAETRRRLGVQDAAPVQAAPEAAPMDVDEPVAAPIQDEPAAVAAESPRAPSPFLPPAEQRIAPATSTDDDDETESEDDAEVDRKPVIASPSPVVRRTPGPPIELHGSSSEDDSEPEAKQTTALKSVSPAPAQSVEPSPATLVAPTLRTFVAPPPAAAPEMNLSDSQLASHIVKQADAGLEETMSLRVPARQTRRSPVPSSSQATQPLSKKAPTPSPPKKAPSPLPEAVKNPLGKVVGPVNPVAAVKPANGSTATVDSPDDSTDSEPEPATKSSPQVRSWVVCGQADARRSRRAKSPSRPPRRPTAQPRPRRSSIALPWRPSRPPSRSSRPTRSSTSATASFSRRRRPSATRTSRRSSCPRHKRLKVRSIALSALLTIDEPANVFHASSSQVSAPDRGPPKGWPRPLDDPPSSEQDAVREIAKILPRSSPPPVEKRTTRSQSARISASPEPWGRQGRPAATNKPSPIRSASPATRKVLAPDSEGNVPAYEGTVGDGGRPTRFTNARGRINQVHGATLDQPRSSQSQPRPSQPQPSMLRSVATSIGNAMPSLLKSGPSSSQQISTGPPPPLSQPRSSFSAKLASRKSILDFDAERIARQQASERNDQARYSLPTLVASVPVPRPSQSAWARKAPVSGQDDEDSDDEAPGSQRLSKIFGAPPASARS